MKTLGETLQTKLANKQMLMQELAKQMQAEVRLVEAWLDDKILPTHSQLEKLVEVLEIENHPHQTPASPQEREVMEGLIDHLESWEYKLEQWEEDLQDWQELQELKKEHPSRNDQVVLIVEEDQKEAQLLRQMLHKVNPHLQVYKAHDTLSCFVRLQQILPDVVFISEDLADFSSQELVKVIQQNPAWQHLPLFSYRSNPYRIEKIETYESCAMINISYLFDSYAAAEPGSSEMGTDVIRVLAEEDTEEFKARVRNFVR